MAATKSCLKAGASILALALAAHFWPSARAADLPAMKETPEAPPAYLDAAPYDWNGYYLGGHLGYYFGRSGWSASTLAGEPVGSGSFGMAVPMFVFGETGSWFEGLHGGYNYVLPNRVVVGAEADVTGVVYPNPNTNLTTGGVSILPHAGESYSENVLYSGTIRARIGYAPANWLFYATGGLAWTYDQFALTQLASGNAEINNAWRFGWAAGAGVELPFTPHWTARLEYLYAGYGNLNVNFPLSDQRVNSSLALQQVRIGLDYHFGGEEAGSARDAVPYFLNPENVSVHGQFTGVFQTYPPFHSAFTGLQSLPPKGEGEETTDVTLFLGFKLWQGAEFWINPEIDQGFGVGNTLGIAGYVSGEAYKKGDAYPYARLQRFFLRQTVDLGGETEMVEADQNVFEGSRTSDRLVFTVGKYYVTDLFDTNKYANNSKGDFLNWTINNTGSFDFVADAWGTTFGAAAEWYKGNYTLRAGVFDCTETPAGGLSPDGIVNDPTFEQLEYIAEAEERHALWGQPGKLKVTGYLINARMGYYMDAVNYIYANPDVNPGSAIQNVRRWNLRPGVSLNLEQQITPDVGLYARAGLGDGALEIYEFTDIDKTLSGGFSLSGNLWGRQNDTVGFGGILNFISNQYQAYLNAGGMGLQIGDSALPRYGPETIFEAYYSMPFYSTRVSIDYQFVANPAYNLERGPVSLFAARLHYQF